MSDLKISNLYKSFPGMDRPAVNNVSLDIKTGGLIAFLGPSGCGKTTLLRAIAGLDPQSSGSITQKERTCKVCRYIRFKTSTNRDSSTPF